MKIPRTLVRCAVVLALMVGALPVYGAVLRSGDVVSVPQDATIPGDFYAMGNQVQISGPVEGDVYVLGGTVTLNGTVAGDVVALGGTVTINGEVKDDIRVVGGKAIVAEDVGGDVMVAAGSLSLLSSAKVAGDVFFYLGEADIEGEIVGDVHARAESVTISGLVHALDVSLSQGLEVRDGATIKGDVAYESPDAFSRAHSATIEGTVMRRDDAQSAGGFAGVSLMSVLMSLFATLLVVVFFKGHLTRCVLLYRTHIPLAGLVGISTLVVTPFVIGLLLITLIGMLPGLVVLFLYVAAMIGAYALVPVALGAAVSSLVVHTPRVTLLWALLGVVLMHALFAIPILGWLCIIVLFVINLGILVREGYRTVSS